MALLTRTKIDILLNRSTAKAIGLTHSDDLVTKATQEVE